MEANTDMREGEAEEGGGEEEEKERGGTTGGTYCQVGPRGVARVAPLSDSTHKREVGKTLAVGIEIRKGKTEEERRGLRRVRLVIFYIFSLSNN